jgi:hypothetical protein
MILYKAGGKIHGNNAVPEFIKPYMSGSVRREHGKFYGLSMPNDLKDGGFSMGADAKGFFIYTHRARSKSRMDLNFTEKEKKFIESTG